MATTLAEIAAYRPKDIDEGLDAMRSALDYFHRENDQRAIFLRAYYLITLAVHQAIYQSGQYQNRIFFDPEWVKKLAGKFSLLYFQSLSTQEREGERAWKTAHRLAATNETSVFQDLLLGLNAHINYDLAYGIYLNLKEYDDGRDHLLLPRRKFDHDQVNNILVDAHPAGPGRADARLRRRAARPEPSWRQTGRGADGDGARATTASASGGRPSPSCRPAPPRISSSSMPGSTGNPRALAESIACEGTFIQRSLRSLLNLFSKDTFGVITLEREETVPAKKKPEQAISPF